MSARRPSKPRWPLAAALLALAPIACGVELESVEIDCPPADRANFAGVSRMLEFSCGTLDCHGNAFRPLRIYGKNGLRRPVILNDDGSLPEDAGISPSEYPEYHTGGIDTTDAELLENARSLCGLEPERVQEFRDQVGEADDPAALAGELLTVIRKPRLQERHKGGLIWGKGDAKDQCLINWFTPIPEGQPTVDQTACFAN